MQRYTGTVENVAMRQVRNPYTPEVVDEPVVTFADGYKLVPNIGMRRDLMAAFGHETDDWRGREITVKLQEGGRRRPYSPCRPHQTDHT